MDIVSIKMALWAKTLTKLQICQKILGFIRARLMLDFSSQSMQTRNLSGLEAKFSFNPDMSMYQNPNGYAKEALFISFIKSENPRILNGGTTKLKPEVLENNLSISLFPMGEEMYREIFKDFFTEDEFEKTIDKFLKTLQDDMLKSAFKIANQEDYDNFINKTVDRFDKLMAKTKV